jgi:hypothetical protein
LGAMRSSPILISKAHSLIIHIAVLREEVWGHVY